MSNEAIDYGGKASAGRRRSYFTEEEHRELISAYESSGLTQAGSCALEEKGAAKVRAGNSH